MPDNVKLPLLNIAPPFVALLPLNTEFSTFNVPPLYIAPPYFCPELITAPVELFQDLTTAPLVSTDPIFLTSKV